MGCRGDAYRADQALTPEEGESFHRWQAERFAGAGVDFLYAGIMPALPEAIGMAKAMAGTGPVSYTHLDVYKRQGFIRR